ncbi:MAG: hypothetical protein CMP84_14350 [Gammaproteobacteria bacterium]|nr:hypothetical protein [Gammaproteobacteria bacterium]
MIASIYATISSSLHAVLLALLLSVSHGILKYSTSKQHDDFLDLLISRWHFIALALSMYGIVFLYYLFVLRSSPISSLYPVYTGLSILFVSVVGRFIFLEPISSQHVIGIALIISGVLVMGGIEYQ